VFDKMTDIFSDYYLWILFSQTWEAISKARNKELLSQDISERRAALLFIIQLIGHDATPVKISRYLFREPHSISELLDRMEAQGLVKKVKDLDRKNQVRIELTEKGHEYYETSIVPKNIPEILSVLTEEERKQFLSGLIKLRKAAIKLIGIRYEVPLPPIDVTPPLR
jgi:DNA-binding MarR family transcriptional regulator